MNSLAIKTFAKKTLLIAAVAAVMLPLAYVVAHGTLKMLALGSLVAVAVPVCYFSIERPMLFPFGLYVVLVPLNEILTLGKFGTINKLLGIMTFGAVLFALLRRGEFVKPSPGVLGWMAVGVWMGLSGFWTIDPKDWSPAYLTFVQNFLLYALLAISITTTAELETISTCVVIGGLLACAIGLWPYLHGVSLQGRLVLPGANPYDPPDPNQLAASLLLPLAVLFAATLATRKILPLLANLSGLALLLITIVLTGSRAAMLAAGLLLVYVLIRARRRFSLAAVLLVAAAAVVPFGAWISQRWSTALSMGGAGRTDIWNVGRIAFGDHWLMGSGFASFPAAFDLAVLRANIIHYIGWNRGPHDMVISTAVELGVIGLILVGTAFVLEFRDLSIPRVGGFLDDLRIALQGALLAVFLDGLFLDITNRKYLWLLFIMIALVRSTIINVAAEQRRRTACAALSSRTPVPTSAAPRLPA
jgi:hypothetical protein